MRIDQTEIRQPGELWRFIFDEDEFKKINCKCCGHGFEEYEMTYTCAECKFIFHRTCVQDEWGNLESAKFPCRHGRTEYQYFYGKVTRGKEVGKWKKKGTIGVKTALFVVAGCLTKTYFAQ